MCDNSSLNRIISRPHSRERIARLRDRLQALTEGDATVSKLSVAAGLMGDLV